MSLKHLMFLTSSLATAGMALVPLEAQDVTRAAVGRDAGHLVAAAIGFLNQDVARGVDGISRGRTSVGHPSTIPPERSVYTSELRRARRPGSVSYSWP